MLEPLGISAQSEALYVALAPVPSATVPELAEAIRTTPEETAKRIENLRRLGLAIEIADGVWRALPLTDVVRGYRAQRQSELDAAVIAAEVLQTRLLAAAPDQGDIQVIAGRDNIITANAALLDNAQHRVCIFDKPPYVTVREEAAETLEEDSFEFKALGRGVMLQAVYHPGFDAARLKELLIFAARGEQSRTGPVPMKLTLVDEQVALIPSMSSYTPGHETRVSVVRHPLIVESLQWLFDSVWGNSVPIVAGNYLEGDPRRQMLISLLMSGSTDTAIANQLKITARSVRRWIAQLMNELGVETRLQLGAALVRAHSLQRRPEP